jgi:hypothetical protein
MTDQPPPEDLPPVKGDLFEAPPTDLVAYLRRYGDRYTREAMATRLIEAGHDPDAVEAALADLDDAEPPTAASPDDHVGARLVTRAIVVSAVLIFAGWLLVTGISGPGATGFIAATVGLAALFAVGAIWLIGRVKSVAAMAAIAVFAVLLGLPVALLGGCLAFVNSGGRIIG